MKCGMDKAQHSASGRIAGCQASTPPAASSLPCTDNDERPNDSPVSAPEVLISPRGSSTGAVPDVATESPRSSASQPLNASDSKLGVADTWSPSLHAAARGRQSEVSQTDRPVRSPPASQPAAPMSRAAGGDGKVDVRGLRASGGQQSSARKALSVEKACQLLGISRDQFSRASNLLRSTERAGAKAANRIRKMRSFFGGDLGQSISARDATHARGDLVRLFETAGVSAESVNQQMHDIEHVLSSKTGQSYLRRFAEGEESCENVDFIFAARGFLMELKALKNTLKSAADKADKYVSSCGPRAAETEIAGAARKLKHTFASGKIQETCGSLEALRKAALGSMARTLRTRFGGKGAEARLRSTAAWRHAGPYYTRQRLGALPEFSVVVSPYLIKPAKGLSSEWSRVLSVGFRAQCIAADALCEVYLSDRPEERARCSQWGQAFRFEQCTGSPAIVFEINANCDPAALAPALTAAAPNGVLCMGRAPLEQLIQAGFVNTKVQMYTLPYERNQDSDEEDAKRASQPSRASTWKNRRRSSTSSYEGFDAVPEGAVVVANLSVRMQVAVDPKFNGGHSSVGKYSCVSTAT